MEFWGVEVRSGQSLAVEVGEDKVLHLSQAALGEVKDKNESACIYVEVDGKKLVLGTLSHEKFPQQLFDIVFNKDFVLTHNWKNGSIYFSGYMADQPIDGPEDEFDDESDSEDETIPLQAADNGKLVAQPKQEKKAPVAEKAPVAKKANAIKDSNAGKQKVKIVEPSKKDDDSDDSDDSDDDSDDAMSDDDGSDSEGDDSLDDEDDSDEDDEDSDDDEETPQKVQTGKKRPSESATKTPVPDKKAKLVTPQKTDGKKSGAHVATPHPSKQAAKTPANKSDQKSPTKSGGGSVSCTPCKKNFKNEGGLSAHNKAKHGAA